MWLPSHSQPHSTSALDRKENCLVLWPLSAPGQLEGCSPHLCPQLLPGKPQSPQPQRRAIPEAVLMSPAQRDLEALLPNTLTNHPTQPLCPCSSLKAYQSLFLTRAMRPEEVCGVEPPYHTPEAAFFATLFHCKCKIIHWQYHFCGPAQIIVSGATLKTKP